MANNRMWVENTRTGERFYLAKYYPSTGWYPTRANMDQELAEFFDRNDFSHLSESERAVPWTWRGEQVAMGGLWGAEYRLVLEQEGE